LTGERRAQAEADIQRKAIQAQLEVVQTNINLADAQFSLADELKTANLLQRETNALLKLQSGATTFEDRVSAQKELSALKEEFRFQKALTTGKFDQLGFEETQRAKLERQARETRTAGLRATEVKLQAQLGATNITEARQSSLGRQEDEEKFLALQLRGNQALLSRRGILQSISGITSEESIRATIQAETVEFEKKQRQEIAAIDKEISRLEKDKAAPGISAAALERVEKELGFRKQIKTETEAAQKAEADQKTAQDTQKLLNARLQSIGRRFELLTAERNLEEFKAQSALDFRAQEVQLYNDLFNVSGRVSIISQNILDTDRARLENLRNVNAANTAFNKISEEIRIKQDAIGDTTSQDYKDLSAELDRQNQLRQLAVDKANLELDARLSVLNVTKDIRLEQERYNEALKLSSGIAESLKGAFGDIGEKIAKAGQAFLEATIKNEQNSYQKCRRVSTGKKRGRQASRRI
jgi:hypothetical protein